MNPRALAAELFGTFSLALAVLISINNPDFGVATAWIAGVTLGLFVYTIGPISGCHINPAVTIGLATLGKIDLRNAIAYIAAQLLGAALALGLGHILFASPVELTVLNTAGTGLAEALGTVVFLFGISAVVLELVPKEVSGVVIGGSLFLGISWAAHASNGALNPAVALGIGSLSFAYVWGPVAGAVVGAQLLRALSRSVKG
ncbi:MAG: aquaporin [Gemmatimonadota bacterium]